MRESRTLVVAWGNPDRRDDGVAWVVADRLRSRLPEGAGVRVETFVQLAPEVAELLAGVDQVLFIDAHCDPARGEVELKALLPSLDPGLDLSHHMAPGALLALTRAAYGRAPDGSALAIRADDLSHGAGLTNATARLVPEAVARALEFLGLG